MKKERECSLDILKIIAITIIIFHHYQQGTGAVFKYINFWDGKFYCGYLVELFFVLAGLFSYHYIKRIGEHYNFYRFMVKKIQRLIPLLALSVIVESAIYLIDIVFLDLDINIGLWQILLNAIGIQSGWVTKTNSINGPTWYVSVLLLCYIVFYLVTYLSRKINISYYYFYVMIIFIGIAINTYAISAPFFNATTARGYIAYFTGILLGKLLEISVNWGSKFEWTAWVVFGSLLFLMIFKYNFISEGINYLLVFLMYPAVIIILKSRIGRLLFDHKWIGTLGKITFNVYIWHEPLTAFRNLLIYKFSLNIDLTKLSAMILFTVIAWIIGAISYFYIEKPISRNFAKGEY